MESNNKAVICPVCGHEMGWESDAMSEECGYEKEGHVVSFYTCRHCGTTAEFVERYEEIEL